jgi:hypothetical protein
LSGLAFLASATLFMISSSRGPQSDSSLGFLSNIF